MRRGDLGEHVHHGQGLLGELVLDHALAGAALEVLLRAVLAGQQAGGEREVGHDGRVELARDRGVVLLVRGAGQQVVVRLDSDRHGEALAGRDLEPLPHPLRRVVRQAQVAHPAGADQAVADPHLLLDRDRLVVVVGVVQVDAVGAQPLERLVQRRLDVRGRQARARRLRADLGGQHDLLAIPARLEPFAEHRLGVAALAALGPGGIGVGGVDEAAAGGDEGVQHGEGRLAVRGPAEGVPAEVQREHLQVGAGQTGQGCGRSRGHGALLVAGWGRVRPRPSALGLRARRWPAGAPTTLARLPDRRQSPSDGRGAR